MMPGADFKEFIIWIFYGIVSGSAMLIVNIFSGVRKEMGLLNDKIATLLERTESHGKVLDDHGSRLRDLEKRN